MRTHSRIEDLLTASPFAFAVASDLALFAARIPTTNDALTVMASTRGARRVIRAKIRWDWDSNPGGQRPPAFKAGAIVHSAIPPHPKASDGA